MKQLLEFIPIILFVVAYKFDGSTITLGDWRYTLDGIFSATAVLMIATVVQVALMWLIEKQLEKRLLWTGLAVVIFGSATLLLRDETFIQWKPSVFNWGMAVAFAVSQFIGERCFNKCSKTKNCCCCLIHERVGGVIGEQTISPRKSSD